MSSVSTVLDAVIGLFPPSTILVEPSCVAHLTEGGDVCIAVGSDPHCLLGTELNTVQLSIFSHRFMSIAGPLVPREEGPREGDGKDEEDNMKTDRG